MAVVAVLAVAAALEEKEGNAVLPNLAAMKLTTGEAMGETEWSGNQKKEMKMVAEEDMAAAADTMAEEEEEERDEMMEEKETPIRMNLGIGDARTEMPIEMTEVVEVATDGAEGVAEEEEEDETRRKKVGGATIEKNQIRPNGDRDI